MILFALTVFLSAFLLFQIELIIANFFLPIYGGSYAVWGSCVVFFQTILLLGYFLAKVVPERIGMHRYRGFHIAFLLLPLICFPGRSLQVFAISDSLPITFNIFVQLFLNIGPVFLVLSFLSIITQVWLSESELNEKTNPYILFSISNLGSFGSLLSYPFFFEANFNLNQQLFFWRIGYALLIALNALIVWRVRLKPAVAKATVKLEPIAKSIIVRWLVLSAAGVALFLSVTNIITLEIVPMPLLWVIPLCIYLISFTLNFKKNPWCPQWIIKHIHLFIGISILVYFLGQKQMLHFLVVAVIYFFLLFVLCMYCQHELHRTRPQNSERLPFFYVMNALGGFFGGVFVSWVVPLISHSIIEFLYALLLIGVAIVLDGKKQSFRIIDWIGLVFFLAFIWVWPQIIVQYSIIGLLVLLLVSLKVFHNLRNSSVIITLCLIIIIAFQSVIGYYWRVRDFEYDKRNYYGIYHVYSEDNIRYLLHGKIIHGLQHIEPERQMDPTFYYHRQSTFGDVMRNFSAERVAIIGLGVGVLAAYAQPNQQFDFFELDADSLAIANSHFTFLKNAKGTINNIIGDARIKIQEGPDHYYDMIMVDAFSGDSIPSHLLTKEAIQLYKKRLAKDGVIFFHISNRYLRLGPVLARVALESGAHFAWQRKKVESRDVFPSTCVIMTWNDDKYNKFVNELDWKQIKPELAMQQALWTDDYSTILPILKLNSIWRSLTNFNFLQL